MKANKIKEQSISHSWVLENLLYDPETGIFCWIKQHTYNNCRKLHKSINYNNGRYKQLTLQRKKFLQHRVAWFYMTGKWPKNQIDHIDNDRQNNKWINLREATNGENTVNIKLTSKNTSGMKGVSWNTNRGKWVAQIMSKGQHHWLGAYDSPKKAYKAYCEKAKEIHGEFINL